jgi:hypothetical protein
MVFNPIYRMELPTAVAEVLVGPLSREIEPIALAARNLTPVSVNDLEFWKHSWSRPW